MNENEEAGDGATVPGNRTKITTTGAAGVGIANASKIPDVLIVGAGPTGLVLALWLNRRGVSVRVIDKTAQPGTTSRALVVHARTLEFYRQLGIADEVVARGLKFTAVNLWVRGRAAAHAELGDLGRGLTPFPEMIIFPQDQHERLLLDHLRGAGVEVERETELCGFDQRADGVTVRTRRAGAAEVVSEAAYVAGCDGAHSKVREVLGIGFPGGTYQRVFYVADVQLRGPAANHQLILALDDADFLGLFPMKSESESESESESAGDGDGNHVARLIGAVKPEAEHRRDLTWDDVSTRAVEHMRLDITRVNWFSTYRVHHRVADHFRRGRAFLVGDAAHVHSPVGGQGMNTGIGDAVNLAWKLADVVQGRWPGTLLDSYEPERIAFARRLVATTDRAFTLVSREGRIARAVRMALVPRFLPRLVARSAVRKFMFRTLSQTAVNYRGSPLSRGKAGAVHGGDRLPWVAAAGQRADNIGADNFAPLASIDWQMHVYGQPSTEVKAAAERRAIPLHSFTWQAGVDSAGLQRDAAYLVRPDGYVAAAGAGAAFERYLDELPR